ncbi:unnamed protein product [Miscanthus lutarioriparius]|uniref:glutathione transferase n=1 Tax=Miscanthus lutarioriparius TaxID=422564 RepID=A0A811MQ30_9POAL|nr:unnamed protein product [Miscanthus lutarioriparius]
MASQAMLQVFGQPASTDVARVMVCLLERQLDFELDPSGHQVTLTHGNVTLGDSRDICRYVCTEFPRWCTRDLYGAGALERASIEQWLQAEAQSFDAPSSALALFHLAVGGAPAPAPYVSGDEAAAVESERQLVRVLDVYDGALGRSAYLAGDDFTLADLSHLPNAHYLACSARGRALLASRANVARWYAAISSRPAWRQVVAVQARTAHYPVAFHPSASGHGAV